MAATNASAFHQRACALADTPDEALYFAMNAYTESKVSGLMFAKADEAEAITEILASAGWRLARSSPGTADGGGGNDA